MGLSIRAYARHRGVTDTVRTTHRQQAALGYRPDRIIFPPFDQPLPVRGFAFLDSGFPEFGVLEGLDGGGRSGFLNLWPPPTPQRCRARNGRKLCRGVKVFSVAVGLAKLEFYNHLRKTAEVAEDGTTLFYPPDFAHLPKIDAEFIHQLCAEQLITRRNRNGFPIGEWQKLRERNEALDIFVYVRAAASAAGLDRFEERHWRELERQLGIAEAKPDPPVKRQPIDPHEATRNGGLGVSGTPKSVRRVIKSRWLS